jgi:CBS domain-containing protein
MSHTTDVLSIPSMTVADAMHAGVVHLAPQAPVGDVARAMAGHRIHAIVVEGVARRDPGGERLVWGVVSDRDLLAAALAGAGGTAEDLAVTELATVESTDALEVATRFMLEHGLSHVLVVEPGSERPVGVVSTLDVARVIADAA